MIIQARSISLLRCNDNIVSLGHTYHKLCLSFLQDGVDEHVWSLLERLQCFVLKFKSKNPIFLAMMMISRICSIYIGTSITRILITTNIYITNKYCDNARDHI